MFVRFLTHAGIFIQEEGFSVMIDPWFTDSTLNQPLIEGLSGAKTIDFQLPKIDLGISQYKPDAILISHFHPHHSPAKDIVELASSGKEVVLGYPPLKNGDARIKMQFEHLTNVSFQPSSSGSIFRVGPFFIKAWEQTSEGHLAWSVESSTGHVLHIADARAHKSFDTLTLDPLWQQYQNQDFDLIFITAGKSHLLRKIGDKKKILENCILSPVQGAQLVQLLKPKAVSLIGIYNHSIWANWMEYRMTAKDCEGEFQWALDWLAPKTKSVSLRPNTTFGINDKKLLGQVDTYIQ